MVSKPSGTGASSISLALEQLALSLGDAGAVPLPELVRALDRAAERLRAGSATVPAEIPIDLVSQAEAARAVGVSRQAVNQWVQNGLVRTHDGALSRGRHGPQVSLAEVAVAANRNTRSVLFASGRMREFRAFLNAVATGPAAPVAQYILHEIQDETVSRTPERIRVLHEFVVATMGAGGHQREFTPGGLKLLAEMRPELVVDPETPFGRLAVALNELITCADGSVGFDSPVAAFLGLLGAATVGAQYQGPDIEVGRDLARAAEKVWGDGWVERMFEAGYHLAQLKPTPLTRLTSTIMYLYTNLMLRDAQATGVSIGYTRGPGPFLPHRFYGAAVLDDILTGRSTSGPTWAFTREAAGRWPTVADSNTSPFRVMYFEYGLMDPTIYGIRRYCYSSADAGREFRAYLKSLSKQKRAVYLDHATKILTRALSQSNLELTVIDDPEHFDWWKDHVIRAYPRGVMLGLRDDAARRTAHALLVDTSFLPDVVEAAREDNQLRERLRIYIKNLEFDVIDSRYRDDLRHGVARVIKLGGVQMDSDEALAVAQREIARITDTAVRGRAD